MPDEVIKLCYVTPSKPVHDDKYFKTEKFYETISEKLGRDVQFERPAEEYIHKMYAERACAKNGLDFNDFELEEDRTANIDKWTLQVEMAIAYFTKKFILGMYWDENVCGEHAECLNDYTQKVQTAMGKLVEKWQDRTLLVSEFRVINDNLGKHCYFKKSINKSCTTKLYEDILFGKQSMVPIRDYVKAAKHFNLNLYEVCDQEERQYPNEFEIPRTLCKLLLIVGSLQKYFARTDHTQQYIERRRIALSVQLMIKRQRITVQDKFLLGNIQYEKIPKFRYTPEGHIKLPEHSTSRKRPGDSLAQSTVPKRSQADQPSTLSAPLVQNKPSAREILNAQIAKECVICFGDKDEVTTDNPRGALFKCMNCAVLYHGSCINEWHQKVDNEQCTFCTKNVFEKE